MQSEIAESGKETRLVAILIFPDFLPPVVRDSLSLLSSLLRTRFFNLPTENPVFYSQFSLNDNSIGKKEKYSLDGKYPQRI